LKIRSKILEGFEINRSAAFFQEQGISLEKIFYETAGLFVKGKSLILLGGI
jgi:hypothetical protein